MAEHDDCAAPAATPVRPAADERQTPLPSDTPTCEADVSVPPRRFLHGLRTFESFRYRDYAYFFAGALVSNTGSWMQTVALGWLVWELTNSSSALGVVNFLAGIPIFVFIIFAGALADHLDRRRLLIVAQALLMGEALALGWLNQTGAISIVKIYALTLAAGVVSAFMFPAWQAMVPDLVPRRSLLNAIALSSAQFNAARLIGPALAAAVLAAFGSGDSSLGITAVFYVNAVSFLFVIAALLVIKPRQERPAPSGDSPLSSVLAGLRYARQHRRVWMHLASAAVLTIFGMPFSALLPVIAAKQFGLGSTGYSLLQGANGGGALVGALVIASLPHDVSRESIIRWGMGAMALGLMTLALTRSLTVAIPVLVVNGAAFLACVSSINTNLQTTVPAELRGRVMSLFVLSFMGMMPFGALAFGALGDLVGASYAVLTGAAVLLAWSAFLLARPALLCAEGRARC